MTRASDPAKSRAALLEAARSLIAELGVSGASLEAISRRAGLTKGAFYYAFPSKAALLTELASSASVTLLGHGVDLLTRDPLEAAAELIRAASASREDLLLQVELWLYAGRDPDMRERLARGTAAFAGELQQRLQAADVADAETVALATRSLILGLVMQLMTHGGLPVESVADVLAGHMRAYRLGSRRDV